MEKPFSEAIAARRTYYSIGSGSPVSDEALRRIVARTIISVPSAFNSQSARAVLLLGRSHSQVWDIALEALRKIVPAAAFGRTKAKIASFAAGHGTILFFDDAAVTDQFAGQYPSYRDSFPVWAQQANGMLQLAVWTALEEAGLGASLQHYNPLIDEAVKRTFGLPESWRLIAEMPFGERTGQPGEKEVQPAAERLRVLD